MNITDQDKEALKQVKRVVEKITKAGTLPNTVEGLTEMFTVWNLVYKKNEKVTNCPTCRPKKFAQLKQTYDLFDLKDKYNPPKPKRKRIVTKK